MLRIYYEYKVFLDSVVPDINWKQEIAAKKARVQKKIEDKEKQAQMQRDKKAKENLGTTGHSKPHNQANQGAAAAANANNRSDDNQVAIPKDLREVIEDSDDEYALFFE